MSKIIGRSAERLELEEIFNSDKPELVAIYGRRRVGKTYLVNNVFKDRLIFSHTGISPVELGKSNINYLQLQNFASSLRFFGLENVGVIHDWFEAFDLLRALLLEKNDKNGRMVVFLDELPWLDLPKSCFMTAFEHFWNGWGSSQDNLMVIVCGSATSWITDKLINNHGGLYGRVTREMHLLPFSLLECEEFLKNKGLEMDRYSIVQTYMVTGGIPFYLEKFKRGLSVAQNIDNLFFKRGAVLANEFERLFGATFSEPELCRSIVKALASKREGLTRNEIVDYLKASSGGYISTALSALEASDFIEKKSPSIGKGKFIYRLTDCFVLFALKFLGSDSSKEQTFWQDNQLSPSLNAWRGLAFENVCLAHIEKIKSALEINGVSVKYGSWHNSGTEENAQIDLLLVRADRVINLCEIKFTTGQFTIDKSYDKQLRHKIQVFTEAYPRNFSSVQLTMITTFGLKHNQYSNLVSREITLDDLFR